MAPKQPRKPNHPPTAPSGNPRRPSPPCLGAAARAAGEAIDFTTELVPGVGMVITLSGTSASGIKQYSGVDKGLAVASELPHAKLIKLGSGLFMLAKYGDEVAEAGADLLKNAKLKGSGINIITQSARKRKYGPEAGQREPDGRPPWMKNPHANHVVFKRGLEGEMREVVEEVKIYLSIMALIGGWGRKPCLVAEQESLDRGSESGERRITKNSP